MIPIDEARRHVELQNTALSDVGYGGKTYVPPAADRRAGARISFSGVPVAVAYKATLLRLLAEFGADHPVVCRHHVDIDDWAACCRYPVGGVLAGATRGCAAS